MARLQLNLTETHDALIRRIMALSNLKTKTDVVENALLVLGWAVTEAHKGAVIAAIDERNRTYKEVLAQAIEGARMAGQALRERDVAAASAAAAPFNPLMPGGATSIPMAAMTSHAPTPPPRAKPFAKARR